MKKTLILIVLLFLVNFIYSQGQGNTFPPSGNVGIGTLSPTAKTDIYLPSEGTMESGLRITSPFAFQMGSNISSSLHLRSLGLNSSYYSQLIVKTNGKVGIGEENPKSKLHVHNGRIQITGNNSFGGPMMIFGGDINNPNGEWGIEYVPNGEPGLNFWKPSGGNNSGNYKMFIADNGNIGIDTNKPLEKFHIKQGNLSVENGKIFIGDVNIQSACSDCQDYKLFVRGGIRTEKVKVDLAPGIWADYVFEDGYELKSLEEVENFIKTNKHLSGIPNSNEVETNGINIGKMDAKLLEKIEELTLYLIKQNKRIKLLEEDNRELKELLIKK